MYRLVGSFVRGRWWLLKFDCVWDSRGRGITSQGQMSTVAKVTTSSSSPFPGWVWGPKSSLAVSVSYYCKQNPIALCKTAHIYYCSQVYRSSGWFFWSRPDLTGFSWTQSCTYGQLDGLGWPWLEELTEWGLFSRISHISPACLFI